MNDFVHGGTLTNEAKPSVSPAVVVSEQGKRRRRGRRQKQTFERLGPALPEGLFVSRNGRPVIGLANLYFCADLFLFLSGPSLTTLPLDELKRRGIMTMAVNNAACVVRPNIWTCVDPPEKFHSDIWDDPAVLKLFPVRRFWAHVRRRDDKNEFYYVRQHYKDMPGALGYIKTAVFNPINYLQEAAINSGNSKKYAGQNGQPHILNVMFAALKIPYYLGFRRVFLCGCDFRMEPGGVYCFDQGKELGAMDSNNGTYAKLNVMLARLRPVFDEAGYKVYNCNALSGLKVFPHVDFMEAINDSVKGISARPATDGWYSKGGRPAS